MTKHTSVALTAKTEQALLRQLVRDDGQEDLCLATYRPSTGKDRASALITGIIPPEYGDRHLHGNVTVTADYVLRAANIAQQQGSGLVLLHSHPKAGGWQSMRRTRPRSRIQLRQPRPRDHRPTTSWHDPRDR